MVKYDPSNLFYSMDRFYRKTNTQFVIIIDEWDDGYSANEIIPPDPNHEIQNSTGSKLEPKQHSIYNPLSVIKAVSTGIIRNYWTKTETYEALANYIKMDYDGLKDAVALLMNGLIYLSHSKNQKNY